MELGVTIRNMGSQSSRALMSECSSVAEKMGFESIWVVDHIAIPPDDAEGSGGRYLDPLTTLAWLAGITKHVKLGSGVLILPYRSKLPTAKQIATIQELSENRLILGVGIGWMDAEFHALGVNRHARGRISDDILEFFNTCFSRDQVEQNGQQFLFNPRPPKPPFLIGGQAPHAIQRAAKYGDGWLPMAGKPEDIIPFVPKYRALTDKYRKPPGEITVSTRLPLTDLVQTKYLCGQYNNLGVDRLINNMRYNTIEEFREQLVTLAACLK